MSATPGMTAPHYQATQTEAQWQKQIADMARTHGATVIYHTYDARGSDKGYPDLTIVHPDHGTFWFEVKGPRGKLSDAQRETLRNLQYANKHAYVVYPRDFTLVDALLRGEVPRPQRGAVHEMVADLLANQEGDVG